MIVQGCKKKLNEWVILPRIKNGVQKIDYLDSTQDLLLGLKQINDFSFQIDPRDLNKGNQKGNRILEYLFEYVIQS